jgi:hypothetical protein
MTRCAGVCAEMSANVDRGRTTNLFGCLGIGLSSTVHHPETMSPRASVVTPLSREPEYLSYGTMRYVASRYLCANICGDVDHGAKATCPA